MPELLTEVCCCFLESDRLNVETPPGICKVRLTWFPPVRQVVGLLCHGGNILQVIGLALTGMQKCSVSVPVRAATASVVRCKCVPCQCA